MIIFQIDRVNLAGRKNRPFWYTRALTCRTEDDIITIPDDGHEDGSPPLERGATRGSLPEGQETRRLADDTLLTSDPSDLPEVGDHYRELLERTRQEPDTQDSGRVKERIPTSTSRGSTVDKRSPTQDDLPEMGDRSRYQGRLEQTQQDPTTQEMDLPNRRKSCRYFRNIYTSTG